MRTWPELQEKLSPYEGVEYIYDPEVGYIAWHLSTGGNVEILFIEAAIPGLGQGGEMYRRMALQLLERGTPYHSVFGYRLKSNRIARRFYSKMGWTQVSLGRSIYAGDETVVMWTTWDDLLTRLGLKD